MLKYFGINSCAGKDFLIATTISLLQLEPKARTSCLAHCTSYLSHSLARKDGEDKTVAFWEEATNYIARPAKQRI